MLILVIDVCTDRGVTAFVEEGRIDYLAELPFGLHNSRSLVPKIEGGLQSLRKDTRDIDLIAVGIGPGSYTGMRVGSIVAKSLSYAHKIPLAGLCSLEGFIPNHQGTFAAMIDAKMAGCYLLKGEKSGDVITYASNPGVWTIGDAEMELEGVEIIVSPNCNSLKEKFKKRSQKQSWVWEEKEIDVQHFANRAHDLFQKKKFSTDGSVDLLYMR